MGPFGSPQTQPCSQLALACPGTATRQLSVNFPSPRFVRRTFFRSCGCLLGPVAGIGIGAGAGTGTSDKGPGKTGHGPQKVPPIHFRPQQKNTACFDGSPLHRLHRRIALDEWKGGDFRNHLHQAPRNLGEVPSSSKHQNFSHGKAHHSLARLQDRLFIQYFSAKSF